MDIGIIGDGPLGAILASLWSSDRHDVEIASGSYCAGVIAVVEAAAVVLLAEAWRPSLRDDIAELHLALAGKVVIDLTNPTTDGSVSFAELLAQAMPDVHVVKVANTVTADILQHAFVKSTSYLRGLPVTIFYCGDDAEAKLVAGGLIGEAGLDPVDAGPLSVARLLEPLGTLFDRLSQKEPGERILAINAFRETPQSSPIDAWM